MKFTKVNGTEIRRVKDERGAVLAIIGRVDELLKKEIIFPDNTEGNMDKWLMLARFFPGDKYNILQFYTLEEAKQYARDIFTDESAVLPLALD